MSISIDSILNHDLVKRFESIFIVCRVSGAASARIPIFYKKNIIQHRFRWKLLNRNKKTSLSFSYETLKRHNRFRNGKWRAKNAINRFIQNRREGTDHNVRLNWDETPKGKVSRVVVAESDWWSFKLSYFIVRIQFHKWESLVYNLKLIFRFYCCKLTFNSVMQPYPQS
jgi:hypothetical protein